MEEIKVAADLKILIAECTAYDYKVKLEERKPKSWLKSVSAFADTRGGSLFFGVDNNGIVNGLDDVQHVCEVIRFKGNILLLLREAVNFVKSNTRNGWEKLPDGRKNKREYAERAVLEALVNHFIHRDYTVMGGEVHLDIYDDRITVTSPGGMYSGQKVQDIPIEEISSDRRNPILADVMAQLDYMEKRGSGLKRICNETRSLESYKENRKPMFKSSSAQFMTTIYSMAYEHEGVNEGVNKKLAELGKSVQQTYVLILENQGMNTPQLVSLTGLADATIERHIAVLRKKGLIEHRGSAKTGGYYPVS